MRKIIVEDIYLEYFKPVYHFVLKLTKNKETAEDITSETFLKVINSIDSFKGETNIYTWICQIAKNTYFSYFKKNKKYLSKEDISQIPNLNEDDFVEKLMVKLTLNKVLKVLATYPNNYKEVFYLRSYYDLSFKEIGEKMNKSENWACVTYYRCKNKIKKDMEEGYE